MFGKNQRLDCFVWSMRLIVIILNIMPIYLINYELLEWQENKMDATITKYLFNAVEVFNILSYVKASWKKPKPIPKMA